MISTKTILMFILILMFTVASSCSVDGIKVELNEDGSGKASLTELIYRYEENQRNLKGFTGFSKEERITLIVDSTDYSFEDPNRVNLGGIRMQFSKKKKGGSMKITIPLLSSSSWARTLHLDKKKKLKQNNEAFFKKLEDEEGDEVNMMASSFIESMKKNLTTVYIEYTFPGNVVKADILEPGNDQNIKIEIQNSSSAFQGLGFPEESGKKSEVPEGNSLKVSMPLEYITENKYSQMVIQAEYKIVDEEGKDEI